MQVVSLVKPITVKGKETNEVTLDFEKIRGTDLIAAEKEVRKMGDTSPTVFLSMNFQAVIAAKLMGIPVEDLYAANATDFKNIIMVVANFLLA